MNLFSLLTSRLLVIITALLLSVPVWSQEEQTTEEDEVEEVVIAGSRIVRDSLDSSGNVQIYTAADIADTGALTVADFLRSNTGNSFGSFNERSGSSAQSNAAVSLKGLGSSRTLVLINGKRAIGSPAFGGSSVNVNLIPSAAVDRVEIILDGAASVYGSDAISGVINVVLKSDFEGSSVNVETSMNAREGGETEKYSYVSGSKSEDGYTTWGLETQLRAETYDRDRDFTSQFWNDVDGDGLVEFYDETDGWSLFGRNVRALSASLVRHDCTAVTLGVNGTADTCGTVGAVQTNVNGTIRESVGLGFNLQSAPGCGEGAFDDEGPFLEGYYLASANNLTMCGYAYAAISAHTASLKKNSFFLNNLREINDDMRVRSSAYYIKNESFGIYAPAAATWPNFPGTNELNPWSEAELAQRSPDNSELFYDYEPGDACVVTNADNTTDVTGCPSYVLQTDNQTVAESSYLGYWRWTGLGPRGNTVIDTVADATVEFEWDISDALKLNAYVRESRYYSSDRGDYYLDFGGLDQQLAEGNNLADQDVIDKLRATTHTDNRITHSERGFGFNIDPGVELGGGDLLIYAGFETYKVRYISRYDANSEFEQVGGSAGNSAAGEREATAIFGEVLVPLLNNLDLSASFRNDDYSDVGAKTSFKFGANWQITDGVSLIASIAEGFRAPGLDLLQAANSFSAEDATDYAACFRAFIASDDENTTIDNLADADCAERQVDTWYFPNPGLLPEDSSSMGFNVNIDFDVLFGAGGRLSVSQYNDEISNIISRASTQDIIWADYFGSSLLSAPGIAISRGDPTYTGLSNPCNSDVQGIEYEASSDADRISFICATYVNVGTLQTSGLSLEYDVSFDFGNNGELNLGLSHSQVLTYDAEAYIDGPVQDQVGWPGGPAVRRIVDIGYDWNDLRVLLAVNFIDSHAEETTIEDPTTGSLKPEGSIDSWQTMDLAVQYDFKQYGVLKIDISNLADEDPPLESLGTYPSGFYGLYNTYGQVTTIGYTYDF